MGKKFRFIVNLDRPRGYEAFAVQTEDMKVSVLAFRRSTDRPFLIWSVFASSPEEVQKERDEYPEDDWPEWRDRGSFLFPEPCAWGESTVPFYPDQFKVEDQFNLLVKDGFDLEKIEGFLVSLIKKKTD
jgi:hypothetical protein